MKKLLTAMLVILAANAPAKDPLRPFPQHTVYANAILRPSRDSQTQQDNAVKAAYAKWKQNYLREAGTEKDGQPRYRIAMSRKPDAKTTSESQGYGMVILPLMAGPGEPDAQKIFDGLWEYSNDHRSAIDPRLMDWEIQADEKRDAEGNTCAFDGDADIAFALLLADAQWGSEGRVNYRKEALEVIAGLEENIGIESKLPLLGDWARKPEDGPFNDWTVRTSDFMPEHFRAFAAATHSAEWRDVITTTQDAIESLQTKTAPATGLLPDFTIPTSDTDHTLTASKGKLLEGENDGAYAYNAGRVPWRIGVDAVMTGDLKSREQARRISAWIRSATGGDPKKIRAGYTLDGKSLKNSDYFSTFFVAPFGVAAMADQEAQQWLNNLYDTVKDVDQGYYEDSVSLQCLIVMTGNYWAPPMTNPPAPNRFPPEEPRPFRR